MEEPHLAHIIRSNHKDKFKAQQTSVFLIEDFDLRSILDVYPMDGKTDKPIHYTYNKNDKTLTVVGDFSDLWVIYL